MAADDLARRRATKASTAVQKAASAAKPAARRRAPKPPPFWRWMASQRHHSDPRCSEAAAHIGDRFGGYSDRYNHARVLRALTAEDSPHLVGAKMLADEYFRTYKVSEDTQVGIAGSTASFYPFEPEVCGRCTRDAVPGTGLCARHGGQWVTDEDRQVLSAKIADRMDVLSERAMRVLEDLLDNARSEKVRLDAANTVLDRAGFGAVQRVQIETDGGQNPADVILERIEQLSSRALELVDSDVVDAEVVGE